MDEDDAVEAALAYLDAHQHDFKRTLVELSRIPGISAPGFPPQEVRRSAHAMADALGQAGLENVEVLTLPGAHPYAYGDWLHAPGAPTILIYGHHDVQPPGRPEKWISPAFEPAERGGRLYGRGTADDKGGCLAHVAAVAGYLRCGAPLPCNVRFLIEGEEEIGSPNLGRLLAACPARLQADFLVLSDTANFDTGIPALTYQLRGGCQVEVEVRCLERPLHGGMWGGPIPDPAQILCGLIAGLRREDGSVNVPGLYGNVAQPSPAQRERIKGLPFDEGAFKRQAGLLEGVELWGEQGYSVYEQLWTRPALTVMAMESQPLAGATNQIVDSARARLSLRTVPTMDARAVGERLVAKLTGNAPFGVHVTARVTGTTPWWATDPDGPAFDAARRALEAGFRQPTAMIGAGGSIGFVQPFADLLGGVPCLLMGVEDPACNAHSENESLHLEDWLKCMRSAVFLYHELARVPVPLK